MRNRKHYLAQLFIIINMIAIESLEFDENVFNDLNERDPTMPLIRSKRTDFNKNWYSYAVVIVIWSLILTILLTVYLVGKIETIPTENIFDGCSPENFHYKHLIKIWFGSASPSYNYETTCFIIDILDRNKKFLTRFAVKPELFHTKYIDIPTDTYPDMRMCKFVVNRLHVLPEIGYLRITHDCYTLSPVIKIYKIEIRDLTGHGRTSVDIPVYRLIKALGPDAEYDENCFQAEVFIVNFFKPDGDLIGESVTGYLSFVELVLFLFLFANIVIFCTLLIPKPMDFSMEGSDMMFSGFGSFVIGTLITALLLAGYRYGIKTNYALNRGVGSWSIIRIVMLTILSISGFVFGGLGGFLASSAPKETDFFLMWAGCLATAAMFLALILGIITALMFTFDKFLSPQPAITKQVIFEPDETPKDAAIIKTPSNAAIIKSSSTAVITNPPGKDQR